MENPPSNPMSDYDFAEIPEDNDDDDEESSSPPSAILDRFDPRLRLVLSGYNLTNEVLQKIAQSGLRFGQLSSLTNEDMEMFGVEDKELQDVMLNDFRDLADQDDHFLAIMGNADAKAPETSVIDLIQNQLLSMNTLLAATIIKVGAARTSSSAGVVVNQNFNSPQVVIEMLQQLTEHGNQMNELINKLKNRSEMDLRTDEMKRKNLKKNAGLGLLMLTGIVIGFLMKKYVLVKV